MNDTNHDPASDQPTARFTPESPKQTGTEHDSKTDTTALTPIRGSNGYQQQIAFDPTSPLDLSVTNASGEVRVTASDQPNVWVVVRRKDGRNEENEVQITVSVDGNRISVRPSWQVASGLSGFAKKIKDQLQNGLNTNDWKFDNIKFTPDLEYDIRVEVPRSLMDGSRFSLKTASGSITAAGLRDRVSIATASGGVQASQLEGRVTIHSASGSVKLQGISGSLEINTASGAVSVQDGEAWTALRTVSGSVSIDRYTMKNARVTTVSGSVQGDAIINNVADYNFETVSGSLRLNLVLPSDSTTSLGYKSISGSPRIEGEFMVNGKRTWHAGSGDAGPAIHVRTVSGSLRVDGHVESTIPTRHEALPEAIEEREFAEGEPEQPESFAADGFAPPAVPPLPAFPPLPRPGVRDRADQQDATEPIFTPPADWPDWIKTTARSVEETARHVVTSFQQPVEPLTPPAKPDTRQSADRDRQQAEQDRKQADQDALQAERDALQAELEARHIAQGAADPAPESVPGDQGTDQQIDKTFEEEFSKAFANKWEAAPRDPAAASTSPNVAQPESPTTSADAAAPSTSSTSSSVQADADSETHRLENQDEAERLRILEALERGDIDIDEALFKIEQKETRGA